ncbi:4813_t:CDS:2, partial [Racocetra persica]
LLKRLTTVVESMNIETELFSGATNTMVTIADFGLLAMLSNMLVDIGLGKVFVHVW